MIRNNEKSSKEVIISKVGNIISNIDEDIIYLIGRKENEGKNTLYKEMEIVISDGTSGKLTYIDLKDIKGYYPKIVLGEFTSPKKHEILFTIEEMEREGNKFIIYRFNNGEIESIFDSKRYLLNNRYKVIYSDDYKVNLRDSSENVDFIINIENKDYRYLNRKYESDGKLLNNYQGEVLSFYEISEVRSNDREVFDLLLKQKIIGEDINDILGEIISTLRFDGDNFKELNRKISIENNKKTTMNFRKEDFTNKKYDFSKVDFIEAEYNGNLRIERAIEKEFLLNPSFDKFNYLYNRIKLNNSDKCQIIVYLEGPKFCTLRGGTILILEEKNNDYIVTSKIKDIIPPIIISENISSGYNDLIVRLVKKDKVDFRVLKYNGNSYPMNPLDEEKLESGIKVVGLAVISDDLFYKRGIEY